MSPRSVRRAEEGGGGGGGVSEVIAYYGIILYFSDIDSLGSFHKDIIHCAYSSACQCCAHAPAQFFSLI